MNTLHTEILNQVNLHQFLESLEGVSYIIDGKNNIVFYTQKQWNKFASENNGDDLLNPETIIGKKITNHFSGKSRELWETLYQYSRSYNKSLNIPFKCDAPNLKRHAVLLVTPLPNHEDYLLNQSIFFEIQPQPTIKYLDYQSMKDERSEFPVISVCSFCKKVKDDETGEFIPPQEYYAKGGIDDVQISHGVCNPCSDNLLGQIDRKLNYSSDAEPGLKT